MQPLDGAQEKHYPMFLQAIDLPQQQVLAATRPEYPPQQPSLLEQMSASPQFRSELLLESLDTQSIYQEPNMK